jgi:Tuberculosis necrotizing toxin
MNRTELLSRLREARIPDDLYSLQGVHELYSAQESCYFLGGSGNEVSVGVYERGHGRLGFVGDEETACQFLHGELVFDEPDPVEFDADADYDAARRSAELVDLVNGGLDDAARQGPVTSITFILQPGDVVDRFGQESGTFLYPDGTPAEQRSQPPGAAESTDPENPDNYFRYRVLRDIPVMAGIMGPAFEQPGGAVMFKLDPVSMAHPPALLTVRWLVREGYLRRVL